MNNGVTPTLMDAELLQQFNTNLAHDFHHTIDGVLLVVVTKMLNAGGEVDPLVPGSRNPQLQISSHAKW